MICANAAISHYQVVYFYTFTAREIFVTAVFKAKMPMPLPRRWTFEGLNI